MYNIADYIDNLPSNQQMIMNQLHQLLIEHPKVDFKLRYRVPFYRLSSWFCYLNPIKNQGVEISFIKSRQMSNVGGQIDFKDKKIVGGTSVYHMDHFEQLSIRQLIQEAFLLEEQSNIQ